MRLETSGLTVEIDRRPLIEDISLELSTHRFIGILGPNGSGKSTLLRTFYKALKPAGGSILVNGRDLAEISHRRCAGIFAVLPQHSTAEVELTVEELLYMGRYPYKKMFEGVTAAERGLMRSTLERLGLAPLAGRRLSTLSGGERQTVGLARALVQDTPCLLLDEPTNHLDIHRQIMILDVLHSLEKKVAAVFHDLSLAGKYCDYLYVLQNGRLAAQGRSEEVLTRETVKRVYNLDAENTHHPRTGKPVVLL